MSDERFDDPKAAYAPMRDLNAMRVIWRMTPDWVKWLALSRHGARLSIAFVLLCWLRGASALAFGDLASIGVWLSAAAWAAIAFLTAHLLILLCRINRHFSGSGLRSGYRR